jgi:phosphatidylethanolamine/phosphatidyl-N-methylethanolamine N-methyltransferase
VISRLFGGNKRYGCYALAVTIFSLGIFRDFLYERALRDQPSHQLLQSSAVNLAAYALIAGGNILVLTSMWALGVTGTYLGDYFGILMDEMVTGFPFNVTGAPMYYGSTMSFLGSALLYNKPAGVLLSVEVLVVYLIALQFEEYVPGFLSIFSTLTSTSPFTAGIYAKRERERKGKGKSKKSR